MVRYTALHWNPFFLIFKSSTDFNYLLIHAVGSDDIFLTPFNIELYLKLRIYKQRSMKSFIRTHVILSISERVWVYKRESTVLKFIYSDYFLRTTTLIYEYRLHWIWVQCWEQTHNIGKILIILINDSNHSL